MRQYRCKQVDSKERVLGWYFEHKGKSYIIPDSVRILPLGYTDGPPSLDGFIEVHPRIHWSKFTWIITGLTVFSLAVWVLAGVGVYHLIYCGAGL